MIKLKSKEEIEKMREAGVILANCHKEIEKRIRPGVTTLEIDQFVEQYLASHGATPEQKGYKGFPFATCSSVNEVICHGFPANSPLQEGDIVTIDIVVNKNGWLADSAWTYAVGNISSEALHLMNVTKKSLYLGIEKAVIGNRIGDISHAIQSYAEADGLSVVRQFVGHGIGRKLHEDPKVPHFGSPNQGIVLKEGMVITIEPMITRGSVFAYITEDGWTAKTVDHSLAAQYEHTIAITKQGPYILTE